MSCKSLHCLNVLRWMTPRLPCQVVQMFVASSIIRSIPSIDSSDWTLKPSGIDFHSFNAFHWMNMLVYMFMSCANAFHPFSEYSLFHTHLCIPIIPCKYSPNHLSCIFRSILFSAFLVLTYFNHSLHSFYASITFLQFSAVIPSSHLCSWQWDIYWLYAADKETLHWTAIHSLSQCSGQWDSDSMHWTARHSLSLCSGQWDVESMLRTMRQWLYALDSETFRDLYSQELEIFHDIRILKCSKISSFRELLRHWLRMRCCVDTFCYIGFICWDGLETFGTYILCWLILRCVNTCYFGYVHYFG